MPVPDRTPHPERSDEVGFDPSAGYHKKIYDNLLLFGPLSDEDIIHRRNDVSIPMQASAATAWFLEEHPDDARSHEEIADEAVRWVLRHEIKHGLKRGWFVRTDDGLLEHGLVPPEHEPLATFGGKDQAKQRLQAAETERVLEVMKAKSNPTRMHRVGPRVASLRSSMEQRTERGIGHPSGQAYPIYVWAPGRVDFVVDGQTRLDIQRKRGVEPWIVEFTAPSPADVLWARVDLEINATTKDQSKEARDAWLARLREAGMTQDEISEWSALSRQRVQQILSTMPVDWHRGQGPTEEEIDEWESLADEGWTVRAIAEETRWGKTTISKYLKVRREGVEPDSRVEAGSDRDVMLRAYADASDEGLTDEEGESITGFSHGKFSGNGGRAKLEKDGLLTKTGKRRTTKSGKRAAVYGLTAEGKEVAATNVALRPMAEVDAEPLTELPFDGGLPTGLIADLRRWGIEVDEEVVKFLGPRLPSA